MVIIKEKEVNREENGGTQIRAGFNYFTDTTVLVPSGRIQILEDGSLLIAAVRANDAGKYTCIRTNEAGSVEDSAFLSVLGTQKV